MQTRAAETIFEDNKVQFFNRLQALYFKAVALQQNAQRVKQSLTENNNEPLLKKTLDASEISLLNYLLEIEFYYNAVNKERDFELTVAELETVEL